jgi:RimJ/RimL family protein N-acetyltransferase
MQATTQLAACISPPVELPSQADVESFIIQALFASAMLGAPEAQAIGRIDQANHNIEPMILIRRLEVGEFDLYKRIRLASLKEAPYAFSSTYESAQKRSASSWQEQADNSAQGPDRATFIAFSDNAPIGLAAIYRSPITIESGEIIQVWIMPEFRGKQVSRKLLDKILAWAKDNRFQYIEAKIIQGNERAFRFYKKHGFAINRTENNDGVEEVVLAHKET